MSYLPNSFSRMMAHEYSVKTPIYLPELCVKKHEIFQKCGGHILLEKL